MKFTRSYFLWIIFSFLSLFVALIFKNTKFHDDPTVIELIENVGYPVEIHEVTTDDGYIVTLHRIPNKIGQQAQNRTPVLLLHGALNSAAEFVNLGPGKALGFLLVDSGYDVWLLNARGTTWSRKHRTLHPDVDAEYWNFSLQEIGIYDVPNTIDYILNYCNLPNLHVIGYSQGAATFFIMASEKPHYNSKVRLLTAMAPAVYMSNTRSPLLKILRDIRKLLEMLINTFNVRELFANRGLVHVYLKNICYEESWLVHLCMFHFDCLHGENREQLNKTMLPTIMSNLPAGVSSIQILHFLQIVATGRFEKYDYGPEENGKRYESLSPPLYNISRVETPVAFYYASNDDLVTATNVEKLAREVPKVVQLYEVPLDKFNHHDFLHAKDAVSLLYNQIIEVMSKY